LGWDCVDTVLVAWYGRAEEEQDVVLRAVDELSKSERTIEVLKTERRRGDVVVRVAESERRLMYAKRPTVRYFGDIRLLVVDDSSYLGNG
jgi:hypothetical protein